MKKFANIKLIVIVVILLISICAISYYFMNKPIETYYKSSRYGGFDVKTERPNKHTVQLVFESTYIPESWRIKCLYALRYEMTKDDAQAKLVSGSSVFPLETNISEHKKMRFTLTIKDNNMNIFKFVEAKKVFRAILKVYDLELFPVFLDENDPDYTKAQKACRYVI